MKQPLGWARVKPNGAHLMRRGAWYPVVNDNAATLVVLDVARQNIAVPRDLLDLRRHRPERFSVVVKEISDPNPVRGTVSDLGLTYAVCPLSRSRIRLNGHPDELECPDCGYRHQVAWEERC